MIHSVGVLACVHFAGLVIGGNLAGLHILLRGSVMALQLACGQLRSGELVRL